MEKLLEGIVRFKKEDFEAHRGLFEGLKEGQKPHTLFITCSDSRVDPNWITQTMPGELFIVRNIANLVPPYRETLEYVATTSAVEYAVLALEVENIIVCGHSNCGGCQASLCPGPSLDQMPHTKRWMELSAQVRQYVRDNMADTEPAAQAWMMEQMNVVEQLKHLMSYPYVLERVKNKTLQIAGWHYIIETGEVYIYNREKGEFLLANG